MWVSPWRAFLLCVMALLCAVLAGCGTSPPAPHTPQAPASPASSGPSAQNLPPGAVAQTAADGRGAIRPLPEPTGCTASATDADSADEALAESKAGDKICITGDLGDYKVKVENPGTPQAPLQVVGDGQTKVNGIDVETDNVVVDGFTVLDASSPEIQLRGNNITLRNSVAKRPTDDDRDNLHFFGDNIKILHNTFGGGRNIDGAHADCMQTFTTLGNKPNSHHVLIDSNRCEDSDNTCLIAEGPFSLAGDGSKEGDSSDFTFNNNYCYVHASEALQIDDIQNVTITGNTIEKVDHAFALQNKSTGAKIAGNTIAPGTGYEVGMDSSSRPGYQGPPIGGEP